MPPSPATEFTRSQVAVALRSLWYDGVAVGVGVGVGVGAGVEFEVDVEVPPFEEDESNDDDGSAPPAPQHAIPSVASRIVVSLPVTPRLSCKLPPGRWKPTRRLG